MVAEGVETQAVLTELTRNGCDQAQGYYLSRPVPAAELGIWLHQRAQHHLDPGRLCGRASNEAVYATRREN